MTDAARLQAFVTQWRALRPATLAQRIAAFAERWRALASAKPAAAAPSRLSAADLNHVVERLRPALAHAHASGAGFDVWRMVRLGRDERRNAHMLAQLLDPRGGHGLGPLPLEGLFDALAASAPDCPRPADLTRCRIRLEERPLGSDRDRIDLVIDHPELLLFVEVKIDAGEGRDQLKRYLESAEAAARFLGRAQWRVAYLTRHRARVGATGLIALEWRTLARAIERRLRDAALRPEVRGPIAGLLDHFANL